MTSVGISIALLLGLLSWVAGRFVRRHAIQSTGRDPADNRINRGFNSWAARHPVMCGVLFLFVIAFTVTGAVWNRTN